MTRVESFLSCFFIFSHNMAQFRTRHFSSLSLFLPKNKKTLLVRNETCANIKTHRWNWKKRSVLKKGSEKFPDSESEVMWSEREAREKDFLTSPPFISCERKAGKISIFLMTLRNYILFHMKRGKTINHNEEYFMLGGRVSERKRKQKVLRANKKIECVFTRRRHQSRCWWWKHCL